MIYLLEDDESIRKLVTYTLEHAGYHAAGFDRPSAFWAAMKREAPELVLLDIMLPEEDGLSVLQKLRGSALWRELPVMMMTAKNAEYDRVIGLDAGADDYISKPFSIRQVIARVKAVLRRTSEKSKEKEIEKLEYETLALDTKRIKATVDGVEVPLTKKEFEILKLLLENKGNVFSREEILSRIWKDEVYVLDRTIDVNITRLRKKIGPYGKNIVTRLGFGYCFEC